MTDAKADGKQDQREEGYAGQRFEPGGLIPIRQDGKNELVRGVKKTGKLVPAFDGKRIFTRGQVVKRKPAVVHRRPVTRGGRELIKEQVVLGHVVVDDVEDDLQTVLVGPEGKSFFALRSGCDG